MQHKHIVLFTLLFVFAFSMPILKGEQFLSVGPEFYYLKRVRQGGTWQSGKMDGIRITYDRIKACSWYLGGDFFAAQGRLKGNSASHRPLHSLLKDVIVEGRAGFTFTQPSPLCPYFTPFGGYGRFHETNRFRPPSPILFTFVDTFNYAVAGFLSGINFTPLLSMEMNFKIDFMINPTSTVKDDPIYDEVVLQMKREINIRLDVPFTYRFCFLNRCGELIVAPFYEFRHFGGQEGFPFDFIDTKFYLIGARLQVGMMF